MFEECKNAGEIIKAVRESRGFSQAELGDKTWLGRSTINNAETFRREPTFRTVEKCLEACGYRFVIEEVEGWK